MPSGPMPFYKCLHQSRVLKKLNKFALAHSGLPGNRRMNLHRAYVLGFLGQVILVGEGVRVCYAKSWARHNASLLLKLARPPIRGITLQFSGGVMPRDARRERIMKWRARGVAARRYHRPLQLLVRHL